MLYAKIGIRADRRFARRHEHVPEAVTQAEMHEHLRAAAMNLEAAVDNINDALLHVYTADKTLLVSSDDEDLPPPAQRILDE